MQLEHLVSFHKALADPTRIRILILLGMGPLHGQALAGKLGVSPPTISHHVSKLREAGLIYEQRDKNTIYFHLREKRLRRDATALISVIFKEEEPEEDTMQTKQEKERLAVLNSFFTIEGKLKLIPAQRKKKLIVFEHLIRGFERGRKYEEKEINAYIKRYHEDYATIRREFIMNQYMYRENGIYELNPPEMWAKNE